MIIRAGRPALLFGPVAQLGERTVRIRKVVGSNPFRSTKKQETRESVSLVFWVHSFHSFTPRVIKMLGGSESNLRQDFAAQNACTAQMRRFWYP